MIKFLKTNFELIFWVAAIIALAVANSAIESQYTLCPLKLMGITWCPGCGIGHAISWLLHGDIVRSWHAHWLGVPALLIIGYRIFVLGRCLFVPKQEYKFD
ncbi:DUF2752 domain-containing protein [Mucilaginibacter sp.]|uniref:DUF2752 domain-containing protein n=1 Tax=Mucilaginibacter sp. TaxID=1882438 RepID=UPI00263222FB|nr:DUF2752 domain-containing protein [Mucilaginibacter sp.]